MIKLDADKIGNGIATNLIWATLIFFLGLIINGFNTLVIDDYKTESKIEQGYEPQSNNESTPNTFRHIKQDISEYKIAVNNLCRNIWNGFSMREVSRSNAIFGSATLLFPILGGISLVLFFGKTTYHDINQSNIFAYVDSNLEIIGPLLMTLYALVCFVLYLLFRDYFLLHCLSIYTGCFLLLLTAILASQIVKPERHFLLNSLVLLISIPVSGCVAIFFLSILAFTF